MKPNVFIFHGTGGSPNENWFPWLEQKLKAEGCKVFVPQFPTPEDQNLNSWLKVFEGYEKYLNENTILIGHSIGCAFILDILEKINTKVGACYLIAGFLGPLNLKVDEYNKTISDKDFNWDKIKNNCSNFVLFQSDNDPYVPMEKAEELKEKLNGELVIIKNAGHFNKKAGYTQFPDLLEKLKPLIK